MNRFNYWLALAIFLGLSVVARAEVRFQALSLDEARARATQSDQLFFLYFAADWCLPCRWMEANTFQDQALSDYANTRYLAVKINFDQPTARSLRERFEVSKLPTLLVFSASGTLLGRSESSMDAPELMALLQRHDVPANLRRPVQATPAATVLAPEGLLDSPRPRTLAPLAGVFYRPPLTPDAGPATQLAAPAPNPAPALAVAPGHHAGLLLAPPPPSRQAVASRTQAPTWASSSQLAPRGASVGQSFGIQLPDVGADYSLAVRQAAELEVKLEQRVELAPQQTPQGLVYRMVVGRFGLRSEAEQFLNYLNRNDLIGEIIALP